MTKQGFSPLQATGFQPRWLGVFFVGLSPDPLRINHRFFRFMP